MNILFHSETKITLFCSYSLSFVVPLVVIRCHSLSLVVSLVVTRCITRCHSLSLVVIRCHSLSFVVTRCHSLYHSLSLVVIRCHSLSLDVPLVCYFINDPKVLKKVSEKFKTTRTHYFINQRSYLNISPINRQKYLLVAIS